MSSNNVGMCIRHIPKSAFRVRSAGGSSVERLNVRHPDSSRQATAWHTVPVHGRGALLSWQRAGLAITLAVRHLTRTEHERRDDDRTERAR